MEPGRDCRSKSLTVSDLQNHYAETYTQFMFTARKIAQMSAFFAAKHGDTINILKLIKLLYLADRESMIRYGMPISFDYAYSMDNGPMLSGALDFVNGFVEDRSATAKWEEWINNRDNHQVSLNRKFGRDDLDELSEADLDVLETIWKQFGHLDQWQLVKYTHENCAEWEDSGGGAIPINEADIFLSAGSSPQEAAGLSEEIKAQRKLDRILSRL